MIFQAALGLGRLRNWYQGWLDSLGLPPDEDQLLTRVLGVLLLGFLCWASTKVVRWILVRILNKVVPTEKGKIIHLLYNAKVLRKTAALTPIVVTVLFSPVFFATDPDIRLMLRTALEVYTVIVVIWILNTGLSAVYAEFKDAEASGRIALQAFIQAIKLVLIIIGILLILSIFVGQSPIYFLSGLGAATAVLMLVFKDVILGLVAGVQINVNNTVRVGDWIDMPKQDANGYVIEISLTNVKVQNWNRTISSIPTSALITESFINWRGMFEAGGRRIKENMYLDLRTVRHADDAMLERLKSVSILRGWLVTRQEEIENANHERGADGPEADFLNARRLTNLGLFRQYVVAYLKNDPRLHTDGSFTFLVRYLQSEGHGLPLQLYVFTKTTVWAEYENVMSDIFEHLYVAAPAFGLCAFQYPSGKNFDDLNRTLDRPEAPGNEPAKLTGEPGQPAPQ